MIVNILDFVDGNYLTLPCGGKAATDKGKGKHVRVPIKLYLQKQVVDWIQPTSCGLLLVVINVLLN